ncbi:hypothetical protein AB0Q95_42520 [Streptomyces sp. NPDC059900]|uniref:hypothetical protein n=1 Tax=Streptomyces sp. NPDC059900 TaxID=3155816 RepID=UPI00343E3771
MWPGEQQPGGGPDQQPNPYHQPGYQQPAPWNAPTVPGGAPPDPQGSGGGNRIGVIAVVTAAAVVVAAGVTGFLVLGGGKDDEAKPGPARSSASESASPAESGGTERGVGGGPKPTIAGWKTVVNAKRGIAFDAPPQWELKSRDWVDAVGEADDEDSILIGMVAPAVFKKQWCTSDPDRDGVKDHTPLAEAGSKGNRDARSTQEIARENSSTWVYGQYTQPDRKNITTSPVESYTTESGIRGSVATSSSSGVEKTDKCRTDGKATTFGFKDSEGKFVSWSFFGAKGVDGEVPDATVKKMLSTVREYDNGSES